MNEQELKELRERLNAYGRNLFIFSNFEESMATSFVDYLLYLDSINQTEPIKIYINSYGGDVFALLSIVDTINAISAPVYTIALGKAMSAGAFLLAAGNKRFVGENATIMVHGVSYGQYGKLSDHNESLKAMEKIEEKLLDIMTAKSNISKENLKEEIFKTDLFLSADEVIRYGLADEILTKESRNNYKLSEDCKIVGESYKLSEEVDENKLSDIQLFQTGEYVHPIYEDLTNIKTEDLELFKKHFDERVRGIDISVENTHENDKGEKPAWGWLKNVYLSNDKQELWAKVEFNADAKKELAKGTYKYVSPEFVFHYKSEKGEEFRNVLLGVALTNRPFQKNKAIKLSETGITENDNNKSEQEKKQMKMTKEEMLTALNSEHSIDVNALMNIKVEKDTLLAENTELKAQLIETEAMAVNAAKEAYIDSVIADGGEITAKRETVLELFATVEDMKKFYNDRKPAVHTKAIGDEGDSTDDVDEAQVKRIMAAKPELNRETIVKGIKKLKNKEGK